MISVGGNDNTKSFTPFVQPQKGEIKKRMFSANGSVSCNSIEGFLTAYKKVCFTLRSLTQMYSPYFFLIILTVGFIVGCGNDNQSGSFPGNPPVKKIQISGHWVVVYPLENTSLSDFLDMRYFSIGGTKLVPPIPIKSAIDTLGLPDNIIGDENNTYLEYWTAWGRVSFANTGGDIGTWSYPTSLSYSQLLSPEISKHIDSVSKNKTMVNIMNPNGHVVITVTVLGRRVEYMTWCHGWDYSD